MKKMFLALVVLLVVDVRVCWGQWYPVFTEEGDDIYSSMYNNYLAVKDYLSYKNSPEWQAYLKSEEYLENKENLDTYYKELDNEKMAEEFLVDNCSGVSELVCALRIGNAKRVAEVMEKGVDVDEKVSEGMTPLEFVVKYRTDLKVIDVVAKAEIVKHGKISATALAMAVEGSNKPKGRLVFEKLMEMGADVNGRTKYGLTPLMVAMRGYDEAAQKLIEAGADVNAKLKKGDYLAYDQDDEHMAGGQILYLWEQWGVPEQISALTVAVDYANHDQTEKAKMLLENGVEIDPEDFSVTCCLSGGDRGWCKVMKELEGVDICEFVN